MQTPSGHCRCKTTQTPSRHEPKTAQTASQKTVSRYLWNPHKTILGATEHPSLCKHKPMQTPSGHCRCKTTQTPSRHEPKSAQTASQKTVSRYLWNPHKTILGATEHMPSLCKHHLDTADAKRPKHHLDTSRKPPKPQAKKLFHVTFGIDIKQSWEPQSIPAYANTSLCKHHLDTADAKRPKHHLDTSRKPPKPQAKKLFHVTFWNPHKTIFGATEPSQIEHKWPQEAYAQVMRNKEKVWPQNS